MDVATLKDVLEHVSATKPMLAKAEHGAAYLMYHAAFFNKHLAENLIGKPLKEVLGPRVATVDIFSYVFEPQGNNLKVSLEVYNRGRSVLHQEYGTFNAHGFLRNPKIRKLAIFDNNKINSLTKE